MYYLDYSDTAVKVGPVNPQKILYKTSEELVRQLSPVIRGSAVAVIIPESDIFLSRTHLIAPATDSSEIKRIIGENTPLQEDEIIFSYKYIPQTKEVITYAMNKSVYLTYLELLKNCKANPDSFIPESALVYEVLRSKISLKETVLFIDIGSLSSELIVLDYYGPVCTFEEDIHEKNLLKNLPRICTYVKEQYQKEVTRIVLSGGGVHTLQGKRDEFPLPTTLSSDYILVPHNYTEDVLSYFTILALEKHYGAVQHLTMLHGSPKKSGSFIQNNILGVIGGIILIATLIFVINKEIQLKSDKIISPIGSTVAVSPTPYALPPTPSPVLSDISFEVLNGSGIEGQAGKVADLLKEKNVTQITTGNADNYNYAKTIIRIKKEYTSFGKELETLIQTKFELDKSEELDSGAAFGVQIVVGK